MASRTSSSVATPLPVGSVKSAKPADRLCGTYRALFGCRLDEAIMARNVRLGCNPARVRFVSAPLAVAV